jgi:hypothetical protein
MAAFGIEYWSEVPGHEGKYDVSTLGRVRSWRQRQEGRMLRPGVLNGGYGQVLLMPGYHAVLVHRLMAQAFFGDPPPGRPLVLHWDDKPLHNTLDNLRYGSYSDNRLDQVRNGH